MHLDYADWLPLCVLVNFDRVFSRWKTRPACVTAVIDQHIAVHSGNALLDDRVPVQADEGSLVRVDILEEELENLPVLILLLTSLFISLSQHAKDSRNQGSSNSSQLLR